MADHITVFDKYGKEVTLDQGSIYELYEKINANDKTLIEMLAKAAISTQLEVMTEMFNDAEQELSPFDENNVRESAGDATVDLFVDFGKMVKEQILQTKFNANITCVRSVKTKLVFE